MVLETPRILRFFFLGMAHLGMLRIFTLEKIPLILFVLEAVFILGAAYRERWVFDKKEGTLLDEVGVFPFFRRRLTSLSLFKSVRVRDILPGGRSEGENSRRSGLSARLGRHLLILEKEEGHRLLLVVKGQAKGVRLEHQGKQIADFCSLPFFKGS